MRKTLMAMVLATMTFGSSVSAQSANCADRSTVVERLAERYSESRQAVGLGSDGSLVEIFAAEDTGSWTITVTVAGGPTCLVAAGQAFQITNDPLPNTDQEG